MKLSSSCKGKAENWNWNWTIKYLIIYSWLSNTLIQVFLSYMCIWNTISSFLFKLNHIWNTFLFYHTSKTNTKENFNLSTSSVKIYIQINHLLIFMYFIGFFLCDRKYAFTLIKIQVQFLENCFFHSVCLRKTVQPGGRFIR